MSSSRARRNSLSLIDERKVKNLVGDFEHLIKENCTKPVFPDLYTQKRKKCSSRSSSRQWIKPETILEDENYSQETCQNNSEKCYRPSKNSHQKLRHKNRPRHPSLRKSISDLNAQLIKKGNDLFVRFKMHLDTNQQLKMYVLGTGGLLLLKILTHGDFLGICHFPTLSFIAVIALFIYILFE